MSTPCCNRRWRLIPKPVRPLQARAASANSGGTSLVAANVAAGLRVIYYLQTRQGQIWMLTLYAKNVVENIPPHVLKKIREEIDG